MGWPCLVQVGKDILTMLTSSTIYYITGPPFYNCRLEIKADAPLGLCYALFSSCSFELMLTHLVVLPHEAITGNES
jgi:hypothetical protein